MREIKFRAWNKKVCKMMEVTGFSNMDYSEDTKYNYVTGEYVWDKIDIELMQYTGLKDKNGKEIYQLDILKLNNDEYDPEYNGFYVGFVEVTGKTCGYSFKTIPPLEEPNHYDSSMFWHIGEENTTEIIGNRFENPELLKGGE
jgi:uncharacterized phage protein (TIGR01671 family)